MTQILELKTKHQNHSPFHDFDLFAQKNGLEAYRKINWSEQFMVVFPEENPLLKHPELQSLGNLYHLDTPYPLASRKFKNRDTVIQVGDEEIGGGVFNLVAGPCAVESEMQMDETAAMLAEKGVKWMRGGAFKPRTSPYSFQGLGRKGLEIFKLMAEKYKIKVVTEVIDFDVLEEVEAYADILQVGARNMHNYYFLKKLGQSTKPVLLKRGMCATIKEWLLAAEYILSHGNENVILCERGVRTFDDAVRNQMDIPAIALIKQLSHIPIWADPSQGTGRRNLITPLSLAAIAAGADGLMVEVHPKPEKARSDGAQSITFDDFELLSKSLHPMLETVGKSLESKGLSLNV